MSAVKIYEGSGGGDRKPEVTMSSRDIAEMYDKNHFDVLKKIRKLESAYVEVFGTESKFALSEYTDSTGRKLPEILLNKSQALFVSARFDPILHAMVQKRWEDLEALTLRLANPLPDFTDNILMAKLYIENEERKVADEQEKLQLTHHNMQLEHQVEELKPKADGFDALAGEDGHYCLTDAAKILGVRPIDLRNYMVSNDWIYRRHGKTPWIGKAAKCNQLLLDHRVAKNIKVKEGVFQDFGQCVITKKGLAKLSLAVQFMGQPIQMEIT